MRPGNYVSREQLEKLLSGFILLTISVFFIAQPIHRPTVINSATILWVIGLFSIPYYLKQRDFNQLELKIYSSGIVVFLICILSWLNSPYFDGSFNILEPEARFLLFPLAVLAVRYSKLTFQHLVFALLAGSAAYIWVTYNSPALRVNGDENAVTFGNGAMLLFIVSSSLLFFEKSKVLKILLVIAASGYLYASFRSGTRGSFLSIIPLGIFLFYLSNNKMRWTLILLLIATGIGISQTSIGTGIVKGAKNTINYFTKDSIRNSTGLRLHMWDSAICLNKERPLLGQGPHQYKNATTNEKSACKLAAFNSKGYFSQAHSFYFNSLATIGILGLLSMMAFFFFVAKYSWSLGYISKVTITAALITFLSYSITVDLLFHRYMADKHLTLLAILLGISINHKLKKHSNST